MKNKPYREGSPTAPQSVYADADDAQAVAEICDSLRRLEKNAGELHDSPLFGKLNLVQWRHLHLHHAAHHFSFLAGK